MSEPSKHSADPFKLSLGRFGQSYGPFFVATVDDANGREVARILELGDEDTNPEAEANARLFAAAPDLLGACRDLLEFWDSGTAVNPGSLVSVAVRDAVARALGVSVRGGVRDDDTDDGREEIQPGDYRYYRPRDTSDVTTAPEPPPVDPASWTPGPDCDDLTAAVMVLCSLVSELSARVARLEPAPSRDVTTAPEPPPVDPASWTPDPDREPEGYDA